MQRLGVGSASILVLKVNRRVRTMLLSEKIAYTTPRKIEHREELLQQTCNKNIKPTSMKRLPGNRPGAIVPLKRLEILLLGCQVSEGLSLRRFFKTVSWLVIEQAESMRRVLGKP